jgi:predicted nuclease with TOPRIM domain
MNVYKPTGEKLNNWPQMVGRLEEEKKELQEKLDKLEAENSQLKRRCCDLFKEVIETDASNAK